jgi:hypothetical protein
MTNGRVPYIYMPDMSFGGLTNFNRYFFAQVGKEAANIDQRFNASGVLGAGIIVRSGKLHSEQVFQLAMQGRGQFGACFRAQPSIRCRRREGPAAGEVGVCVR